MNKLKNVISQMKVCQIIFLDNKPSQSHKKIVISYIFSPGQKYLIQQDLKLHNICNRGPNQASELKNCFKKIYALIIY